MRLKQSTRKLKPPVNQKTEEYFQKELPRVNAELENYPGPIAGCDIPFNHLLEKKPYENRRCGKGEIYTELQIIHS